VKAEDREGSTLGIYVRPGATEIQVNSMRVAHRSERRLIDAEEA